MLFISSETDTFTAEFAELLQRLADNVSFALGSFDRADEKAKTEEQKERLTRMFAALGATNEAIMRAKSRTELFELVCEAATVGGNFTSTAIVLERPGADFLENVASAGPDRERASKVQLSADAASARRPGHHRQRVPHAASPASATTIWPNSAAPAHFYKVGSRQRDPIGRGIAAAEGRQSHRRHRLPLQRTRRVQPRIDRAVASALQRIFRSRSTISTASTRRRRPRSRRKV